MFHLTCERKRRLGTSMSVDLRWHKSIMTNVSQAATSDRIWPAWIINVLWLALWSQNVMTIDHCLAASEFRTFVNLHSYSLLLKNQTNCQTWSRTHNQNQSSTLYSSLLSSKQDVVRRPTTEFFSFSKVFSARRRVTFGVLKRPKWFLVNSACAVICMFYFQLQQNASL